MKKSLLMFLFLILASATCFAGLFFLNDRRYFVVSIAILFYGIVPYFVLYEFRKPPAREVVIAAVLTALCVAGKAAFFMVPSFSPIAAIVIITGMSLGRETAFLVGCLGVFTANFLFGQGPWTPWQMLAYGTLGIISGCFRDIDFAKNRIFICAFSAILVFFVYGAIVDLWTIFGFYPEPNLATIMTVYSLAIPYNLVHAAGTAIFMYIAGSGMTAKLRRVRIKYGLSR